MSSPLLHKPVPPKKQAVPDPRRQQHHARVVPVQMPALPMSARGSPRSARSGPGSVQSSQRSSMRQSILPSASPRRDKTNEYKILRQQEPWGIQVRAEAVKVVQDERAQTAATRERNAKHARALEEQMVSYRKRRVESAGDKKGDLERERELAAAFEQEIRDEKAKRQAAGRALIEARIEWTKNAAEAKQRQEEQDKINFSKRRNMVEHQMHEETKRKEAKNKAVHRQIVKEMKDSQSGNKKAREDKVAAEAQLDKDLFKELEVHDSIEARRRYEDQMRRINTVALNARVGNNDSKQVIQQREAELQRQIEQRIFDEGKKIDDEAKLQYLAKKKEAAQMIEYLKKQMQDKEKIRQQEKEEDRRIKKVQDKDADQFKSELRDRCEKMNVSCVTYANQLDLQVADTKQRVTGEMLEPIMLKRKV